MQNLQMRQSRAIERAVEFLHARENASRLKDMPPAYHVQVGKLALAAQRVATLRDRQGQGTDAMAAEASTGAQMRDKLREEYLIQLGRVCRPHFKSHPGTLQALHAPHKKKNSAVMVAAARAMHKALSARVDVVVEEGFTAKTLEEMEALTNQLEHIATKAQVARDERSRITKDIATSIARGFELVRNVEGFLIVRFRTDRTLRKEWMSARKVPRHIGYAGNTHRHASPGRLGLIKRKRRK